MQKMILSCGILLCSLLVTGKAEAPRKTVEEVVSSIPLSRGKIIRQIYQESMRVGVPPEIALAIVEVESSFNPRAFRYEPKFKTYSVGLFQMFIPTARVMGFKGNVSDLMNPKVNINLGIRYIKKCVDRFGYDVSRIACCHNAGHYVRDSVCENNSWVKDYIRKVGISYKQWQL